MARSSSPSTQFNGYEDDTIYQNINYTQNINEQMRVPKRIKATGEYFDDHELLSNNGNINSWNYHDEKLDMTVPDRIVVMGQDQHLGTRSAPREIVLDNSILSTDPGIIRVSTPPRVISLSEHHFPSASEEPEMEPVNHNGDGGNNQRERADGDEERRVVKPKKIQYPGTDISINDSRGNTPILDQSMNIALTPSEEVIHLRRQMAKLNRRVISIELEAMQRQQRDKIVYCIGLAYFLMKAIMWLNRN